jgi:hypothetical protein
MTYTTLKNKLQAAANIAGVSEFLFGYFDEFDEQNRAGTYPAIAVIPFGLPIRTRTKDEKVQSTVELYIMNSYTREGTTTREAAWDVCDTKFNLFIEAIQEDDNFNVLNAAAVPTQVFPFGLSTDSVIAIKYTIELQIWC